MERALERAEAEGQMSFPEGGPAHVTVVPHQGNPIVFDAERIKIFRLVQVTKDEKQLYVPDVHRYIRSKYATMMAFIRNCEHAFAVRFLIYAAARNHLTYANVVVQRA